MDGDWFSFSLVSRFCFRFLGIGLLANGLFLSFFLLSFRSSKVFAFPDILQAKQKKKLSPVLPPTYTPIYLSIYPFIVHPSIHILFVLSFAVFVVVSVCFSPFLTLSFISYCIMVYYFPRFRSLFYPPFVPSPRFGHSSSSLSA